MSSVGVGLIAFACLFGAAVLGTFVSSRLPEHHQSADTQRIVNLGAGIIGTMAEFILGLLIASAKGSYDTQSNELTVMAAKIALLDHALEFYGSRRAELSRTAAASRRSHSRRVMAQ